MQGDKQKGRNPQMDNCDTVVPSVSFTLNIPHPSEEQRTYLIDVLSKLRSFDRSVVVGGLKATRRLP
jgi:hypothetical protein